jgi:hypothetical protein
VDICHKPESPQTPGWPSQPIPNVHGPGRNRCVEYPRVAIRDSSGRPIRTKDEENAQVYRRETKALFGELWRKAGLNVKGSQGLLERAPSALGLTNGHRSGVAMGGKQIDGPSVAV